MDLDDFHIILGSSSPRRRELLAGLDLDFEVDSENTYNEDPAGISDLRMIPIEMSEGKSHGFHRPLTEGELLLTADTIVLCEGKAFGKPHDRNEAFTMLATLSGRTHEVITAVTLRTVSKEVTFSDSSLVSFVPLTPEEINHYIDKYKPFDKAGAYGVQEWIGYVAIGHIDGSFYNVMGLPVHKVYAEIKSLVSAL